MPVYLSRMEVQLEAHKSLAVVGIALTLMVSAETLEARHNPGPHGGPAGAGDPSLA
jgi:hypothetical protein